MKKLRGVCKDCNEKILKKKSLRCRFCNDRYRVAHNSPQFRHGFSRKIGGKTRFYSIFYGILNRCNNKRADSYKRYGKRGVKCLWSNFSEFRNDMFEQYQTHVKEFGEKNTQIDRIDGGGHYCKENCRWVNLTEQSRNRKNTRMINFNGQILNTWEWAKMVGIPYKTLKARMDRKWPVEKTLTQSIRK